jgi:dephospho-CoA kinase
VARPVVTGDAVWARYGGPLMLLVALTGGIGSGKSTVAAGLAERGAAVVDADAVSRRILEPDGAAYQPVVDRFGPGVVRDDGSINRPALAAVVFGDAGALTDLNRLTHPVIGRSIADQVRDLAPESGVVVIDIPLLGILTDDLFRLDAVIVVDTPEDVAVARLVATRGFDEGDAWARVAAQIDRDERRKLADIVIDNGSDSAALDAEIDRVWSWLRDRVARA